ncbi:hypothetical protein [Rhodococcus sp. CH91]|uniref:hypothetical protein n=1 Tax=Rhodococcus sp. CH91 TaxID=2910256 RepID=UPI001F4B9D13|nr:hypothetical protein [Rhodococcus sp. CH91]
MPNDDVPADADPPAGPRKYGGPIVYFQMLGTLVLPAVAAAMVAAAAFGGVPVRDPFSFEIAHPYPLSVPLGALCFAVLIAMLPVFLFPMYSPRTVPGDIACGRDDGVPALVLRQSRLIYNLAAYVALPVITATIVFFLMYSDSLSPAEHAVALWIFMLVPTCGWQTGLVVLMLLRRVGPGRIALRHDGIHIHGYGGDTWIPWDSLSSADHSADNRSLIFWLHATNRAVVSSRVPRPWVKVDRNAVDHVRQARRHVDDPAAPAGDPGWLCVYVNRGPFRIAPEIIDAAVARYADNPHACRELRDPEAIAATVAELRARATTTWWRCPTRPVRVPFLESEPF